MDVHLEQAELMLEMERWDDAHRHALKALKLEPRDPDALEVGARSAFELGHAEDAMAFTSRLVATDPDATRGYLLMATLASRVDDHALAIKHLRIVVARVPTSPIHRLLAAHLLMDEQIEEGLAVLQISRRMTPHEPDLLDVFARILSRQGLEAQAEELALAYSRDCPDTAESNLDVAQLWVDLERLDHAKRYLLRSLCREQADDAFMLLTECIVRSHRVMRVPEKRAAYVGALALAIIAGGLGLGAWLLSFVWPSLIFVALGLGGLGVAGLGGFGLLWGARRFFHRRVDTDLRRQLEWDRRRGFSDIVTPTESDPTPPERWC